MKENEEEIIYLKKTFKVKEINQVNGNIILISERS